MPRFSPFSLAEQFCANIIPGINSAVPASISSKRRSISADHAAKISTLKTELEQLSKTTKRMKAHKRKRSRNFQNDGLDLFLQHPFSSIAPRLLYITRGRRERQHTAPFPGAGDRPSWISRARDS